jgi:hypothetical protein
MKPKISDRIERDEPVRLVSIRDTSADYFFLGTSAW